MRHSAAKRPGGWVRNSTIDADGLVKVAEVSKQVLEYLAGREQPMTLMLAGQRAAVSTGGSRKVSLGTVPDFSYQGVGYRLDGVVPGSPAEEAGLGRMDIIVGIDDSAIRGLRDISNVLKSRSSGQEIRIRYLRNGKELQTRAALKSKQR